MKITGNGSAIKKVMEYFKNYVNLYKELKSKDSAKEFPKFSNLKDNFY